MIALAEGHELAPGFDVVEHLSRNEALDVYDVWDRGRYCRCVAKTLRPDRRGDQRPRERLLREGELLERFTHPHLVRAYETLIEPEIVVILETLSGETLDHLVDRRERRRLAVAELALLGLQIGSAVRYLHREGWLHLDLKPSNIIVDLGVAKVLDLSLARPPGPGRRGLGTPGYLAPEQALGDEFTAATDVWGLGAVLHEAATGEPRDAAAPGVRAARRLPAALADAIDACFARDPAARPSVDDLLALLERFA